MSVAKIEFITVLLSSFFSRCVRFICEGEKNILVSISKY
jgi:hypothetical protein